MVDYRRRHSANLCRMRRAAIAIGTLAVVAALVIGVVQARQSDSAQTEKVAALKRAQVSKPIAGVPPELAALRGRVNERIRGGTKALDAQLQALRGHPVVVNLWASWCDPCRFELPFLQRQALQRAASVAFLGVNVDDGTTSAEKMASEFPMPYPSVEDPDRKIAARYGAIGLPVTVFYDTSGKRQMVHQGVYANEDLLSDAIDRYALGRAG